LVSERRRKGGEKKGGNDVHFNISLPSLLKGKGKKKEEKGKRKLNEKKHRWERRERSEKGGAFPLNIFTEVNRKGGGEKGEAE